MENRLNLNEILLGLVLLTLPVSTAANSISLAFFFAYNLFERIKKKALLNIRFSLPFLIILIIQGISYFNSHNITEANKKLLLFTSFFVFPFLCLKKNEKINAEKILIFLFFGVLAVASYAICNATYDILVLSENYDYGHGVDLLLKYVPHHTYFSIYVLSSILSLTYLIGKSKWSAYYLLFLPFLYLLVFVLPSRTAMFYAILILPFFVFNFLTKRFTISQILSFFGVALLILVIIGMSFDYARDKLIYTYYEMANISTEEKPFYGISRRKMIWESSWELIKECPFFGYGVGDVQNNLNLAYTKNGYNEVIGMNAHNQYFQNILSYGIFLSFIYYATLITILVQLLKRKEVLLIGLWSIVLIVSSTESILNRQWGVIFFAMVLTLSMYTICNKRANAEIKINNSP